MGSFQNSLNISTSETETREVFIVTLVGWDKNGCVFVHEIINAEEKEALAELVETWPNSIEDGLHQSFSKEAI